MISTRDRVRFTIARAGGIAIETDLRRYERIVEQIREHPALHLTEVEHASRLAILRESYLPPLHLTELFSLISAAFERELGIAPFDEQLIAGVAMSEGKLAQMRTGEGKTVAAVFAAISECYCSRPVQVITANDYLARRDAAWMGPVYARLGLRVDAASETFTRQRRRKAYAADVCYVTARQAGFDYLIDCLAYSTDELVQRELASAIVDEADFILIDEARVPMVVASSAEGDPVDPARMNQIATALLPGKDFIVDRAMRNCSLTTAGEQKVARMLGVDGMHDEKSLLLFAGVHVALHANHLLRRDIDYVVSGGAIELVDGLTGRVAEGRRWPYGIQAALEAREGLNTHPDGMMRAKMTIQDYVRSYSHLAAMTATALPAAEELFRIYGLATVVIPPHNGDRTFHPVDRIFTTAEAKLRAIVERTEAAHRSGRPVLVGTRSVRESEELAARIRGHGIACEVLNARNDEEESRIIASAGRRGAVTISTNMAGRGTDIRLGESGAAGADHDAIGALGGLLVIGTSRQESRRIDDQLRGRAGRQGDPGESQFFVSLEDELFRRFGVAEFLPRQLHRRGARTVCGDPSSESVDAPDEIRDPRVAREIDRAQRIIENQHTQMRMTLRKYSALLELERRQLLSLRSDALKRRIFPQRFLDACEEPFSLLAAAVGVATAEDAAARCFLKELDAFWSSHLETAESIQEGIHLQRLGRREPLLVFIEEVSRLFDEGVDRATDRTAAAVSELHPTQDGRLDLAAAGLGAPATTWTYLLTDNPFPDFNLAMIANSNIGFAAAGAIPALLMWPVTLVLRRLRRSERSGKRDDSKKNAR